jgi:hypothetical protein
MWAEEEDDGVFGATDTRMGVMGIISFPPYFNWHFLRWIRAGSSPIWTAGGGCTWSTQPSTWLLTSSLQLWVLSHELLLQLFYILKQLIMGSVRFI